MRERRQPPRERPTPEDPALTESQNVNPLISKAFTEYAKELEAKHDKYERMVKLSRDITLESKRIIFAIHSLQMPTEIDKTSSKIEERFKKLLSGPFQSLAEELDDEDPHMYLRAYTAGIQEFVEAYTYYSYFTESKLVSWPEISRCFAFTKKLPDGDPKSIYVKLPLSEYLLGIQDLTGELMRMCITGLAMRKVDSSFAVCNFVKHLYMCMFSMFHTPWEYGRKLTVARESLLKMEYACFMMHVRGSEMNLDSLEDVMRRKSTGDTGDDRLSILCH